MYRQNAMLASPRIADEVLDTCFEDNTLRSWEEKINQPGSNRHFAKVKQLQKPIVAIRYNLLFVNLQNHQAALIVEKFD